MPAHTASHAFSTKGAGARAKLVSNVATGAIAYAGGGERQINRVGGGKKANLTATTADNPTKQNTAARTTDEGPVLKGKSAADMRGALGTLEAIVVHKGDCTIEVKGERRERRRSSTQCWRPQRNAKGHNATTPRSRTAVVDGRVGALGNVDRLSTGSAGLGHVGVARLAVWQSAVGKAVDVFGRRKGGGGGYEMCDAQIPTTV